MKKLQNATFEDITDITNEDTISEILQTVVEETATPVAGTAQRRRISNTFSKFPNAKRKCTKFGGSDDEFDPDDPESIMASITGGSVGGGGGASAAGLGDDDDDMVMYDPNESIIAGPDDDDDL